MSHPSEVYITTRELTREECFWLDAEGIPEGTLLFPYNDCTYGCISPDGVAASSRRGEPPFFEVPKDAIRTVYETDPPEAA